MVFSSLLFLFRFLPIVLLLYFLSPRPARNFILLAVSLVFYAWGEPVYVVLMIVSIISTYLGGRAVHYFKEQDRAGAAKISLIVTVGFGLFLLGFFKYTDFLLRTVNQVTGLNITLLNLALPIGISFYTFQTISYVIDVYRGAARVQKNIISTAPMSPCFPSLSRAPSCSIKRLTNSCAIGRRPPSSSRKESTVLWWDWGKRCFWQITREFSGIR